MRDSRGASDRLAVTLRYCITGDAYTTIVVSYRRRRSTVCRLITETCDAIWTVFMREGFLTCRPWWKNRKRYRVLRTN